LTVLFLTGPSIVILIDLEMRAQIHRIMIWNFQGLYWCYLWKDTYIHHFMCLFMIWILL